MYGIKNPIFKPSPITPNYNDWLIFEGISVDEHGKQHYLDVNVAYQQACLNAIEYLTKFGYTRAQAYAILGTAPVQGHPAAGFGSGEVHHWHGRHPDVAGSGLTQRGGLPFEAALSRSRSTRCQRTTTDAPPVAISRRCARSRSATWTACAPNVGRPRRG
jgi:hypothetical protein